MTQMLITSHSSTEFNSGSLQVHTTAYILDLFQPFVSRTLIRACWSILNLDSTRDEHLAQIHLFNVLVILVISSYVVFFVFIIIIVYYIILNACFFIFNCEALCDILLFNKSVSLRLFRSSS